MNKKILTIGCVFSLLSIAMGAFGAHTLKELITADQLASLKTGVQYQMYHALVLIIIGFNADKIKNIATVSSLFIIGILFFSSSIYILSLQDLMTVNLSFSSIGKGFSLITPIGGLLFIAAWIALINSIIKQK